MATTTNYSWSTPDDTALVKDGALAIRTLGSSVDTTVKNLNPETTTGAISYRGATANQKTALPIGTAGQVLQVNSGATAPEWATFSANAMTSIASGSIAASATGVDITSIPSTYNDLILVLNNYSVTSSTNLRMRFNNNTSGDYSYVLANVSPILYQGQTQFVISSSINTTQAGFAAVITIPNYKRASGYRLCEWVTTVADNEANNGYGLSRATAVIDRVTIFLSTGDFDAGTYELFGVK
jgi:hypothetical protein